MGASASSKSNGSLGGLFAAGNRSSFGSQSRSRIFNKGLDWDDVDIKDLDLDTYLESDITSERKAQSLERTNYRQKKLDEKYDELVPGRKYLKNAVRATEEETDYMKYLNGSEESKIGEDSGSSSGEDREYADTDALELFDYDEDSGEDNVEDVDVDALELFDYDDAGSDDSSDARSDGGSPMNKYKEFLGVDLEDVSIEEVEEAYRDNVAEYHPDQGGSVEEFKEFQQAYQEARRAAK